MIVIDTNVLSELMRPLPDPQVVAWVDSLAPGEAVTTSITMAEVGQGLRRLPPGKRRTLLTEIFQALITHLDREILSFDRDAAGHYARIAVARESTGRSIDQLDCMIAAICVAHGAVLATRNERDFEGAGVEIINPWRWEAGAPAPCESGSPSE